MFSVGLARFDPIYKDAKHRIRTFWGIGLRGCLCMNP
jgi:hypothetical protein